MATGAQPATPAPQLGPVDHSGNKLVGDLISLPDPTCRLISQEVHALQWMRPYAGSEGPFLETLIEQEKAKVEAGLLKANPFTTKMVQRAVNHQLRCRVDIDRNQLAVEQWIPAMHCWLVNGYFELNTPATDIIRALEAGDPAKRNPEEELRQRREAAAEQRRKNEEAGDQRVRDVISELGPERIANFVNVERALQTGENITVRGDDRRTIERLTEDTKKAAYSGDLEAQAVIKNKGQMDNPTCSLPTTNPFRHRHRKELEARGGSQ